MNPRLSFFAGIAIVFALMPLSVFAQSGGGGSGGGSGSGGGGGCGSGGGAGGGGAAGVYVPVYDAAVESAVLNFRSDFCRFSDNFDRYAENFNNIMRANRDSIRNILAGNPEVEKLYLPDPYFQGDPDGRYDRPQFGECQLRPTVDNVWAWTANTTPKTPWRDAFELGYFTFDGYEGRDTAAYDNEPIRVNNSASISCLLQELVEWQKLSLFLQIHDMLKIYISDAQATQLSQQLAASVSATIIAWSRQGNERCETDPVTGVVTCTNRSIADEKPEEYDRVLAGARARTIEQKIMDDGTGPYGSTYTCTPFKDTVARQVALDARKETTDPLSSMEIETRCSLAGYPDAPFANESDYNDFMVNFNSSNIQNGGGWGALMHANNNPQDMPLSAIDQIRAMQAEQIDQIQTQKDKDTQSGGVYATYECPDPSIDPNCTNPIIVTPGAVNRNELQEAVGTGRKFTESAKTLDSSATDVLEGQSSEATTQKGGLKSYDQVPLTTYDPQVHRFVQEFFDAINWGYYDTQYGTRKWAEAALLNIYDQMPFTTDLRNSPNFVVPDSSTNSSTAGGGGAEDVVTFP